MTDRPWDGTERRAHLRFELSETSGIMVAVGALGFRSTHGIVLNIGRRGMLILVDQDVIPGVRCEVRFPKGRIIPETTRGRVRRSRAAGTGFTLAIEFDALLDVLNVPSEPTGP